METTTCLRGFSFMPENFNVKDLQYIEGSELERTWKANCRQRIKEQEQKIWDEFVMEEEKDVVKTCHSDPYQFIHELPEDRLKELLDEELQKNKKIVEKEPDIVEPEVPPVEEEPPPQHTVTFAEDIEKDESDVFQIFEDDVSGPEEEIIAEIDKDSHCTVREKESEENIPVVYDTICNKSIENVASEIESNIYWAKIKDLRLKINDEILTAISLLDCLEVFSLERAALAGVRRRAAQFAGTFQRNRLYPLHRQMSDIRRALSRGGPFGRHTRLQALMARLVSLHHNILTAFQVLCRAFEQTFWLTDTTACARALLATARDAHLDQDVCNLEYNDPMLESCDKLEVAINDYTQRVVKFFDAESLSPSHAKLKSRKKSAASKTKSNLDNTDPKLSMYSIDINRLHHTKSTSSKDNASSGTSKMRIPIIDVNITKKKKGEQSPKSAKKSRRPLMRAPIGRRRMIAPKEQEITTMVQALETCTSSYISRPPSPLSILSHTPRKTPRSLEPLMRSPMSRARNHNLRARKMQNVTAKVESPAKRAPKPVKVVQDKMNNFVAKDADKTVKPVEQFCNNPQDQQDNINSANSDKMNNDKMNNDKMNNDKLINDNMNNDKMTNDIDNMSVKDTASNTKETGTPNGGTGDDSTKPSTPKPEEKSARTEKDKSKNSPRYDVTRLLKQLCNVDAPVTKSERVSGSKNAQLHCINGGSPRQPSTPQLLRILEETIQKKAPRSMYPKPVTKDLVDRYRLTFNIPSSTTDKLYQYRTKFVQHMLTSPLYANSAVGKPWKMIGSVSDQIIDDILIKCTRDMQIEELIRELYRSETN